MQYMQRNTGNWKIFTPVLLTLVTGNQMRKWFFRLLPHLLSLNSTCVYIYKVGKIKKHKIESTFYYYLRLGNTARHVLQFLVCNELVQWNCISCIGSKTSILKFPLVMSISRDARGKRRQSAISARTVHASPQIQRFIAQQKEIM